MGTLARKHRVARRNCRATRFACPGTGIANLDRATHEHRIGIAVARVGSTAAMEQRSCLRSKTAAIGGEVARGDGCPAAVSAARIERGVAVAGKRKLAAGTPLTELDTQIERRRQTLAELSEREGVVAAGCRRCRRRGRARRRLPINRRGWPFRGSCPRICLAKSRDWPGRVLRSSACATMPIRGCGRLRKRSSGNWPCWMRAFGDQRKAFSATELQGEIDGLVRTQAELRRHLEHLLLRRQAHTFGAVRPETMRMERNWASVLPMPSSWKAGGWSWNRSGSGWWNRSIRP